MNQTIKSGFLDNIFCKQDSVLIDYDFRNPSYTGIIDSSSDVGYLIFNNQTGIIYQYSGSKIYDVNNPALTYSEGGAIPSDIVSGYFNGYSKLKILGAPIVADWTAFVTFKHLDTGSFTKSKVIFSTKDSDSSLSGFALGINGCNRIFCEHNTPSSGKRIYTLDRELDNKNLISVSKIDQTISIGFHQFDDFLNKISANTKFNLVDYSYSNNVYIGGLGTSDSEYKNFSGYLDNFILFKVGLEFPERNSFAKAFYCSSYETGSYISTVSYFNAVTGAELQAIPVATGITGYQEVLIGTEIVNGGTVNKYSYSGITGLIYETGLVELTGLVSGTSEELFYRPPSGVYDYNYVVPFASSKIVLNRDIGESYREVYSFSGRNGNDLNLIPVFSSANSKYTILTTGDGETINFYANGLAQPYVSSLVPSLTGDFIISGSFIESDGFFDGGDFPIYDIIYGSVSLTGITTGDVASGSKSFSSSYVDNRDIYLNGNKLISGINYSGVGSSIVLNTSDLVDGDIYLLPKHSFNFVRYTGYGNGGIDSNNKLFDEQVWVNGLRQIRELDYEKVPDFSLKYPVVYLDQPSDIIYNNDTGFFNV